MTPEPRSFLVTGHPRSGTTVLTRVLNTHPDIGATFELGAFLGLGTTPGVAPGGFDAGLIRRPDRRAARGGLEGRDLAAVEAAAGEAMRRWGYDPA